MPLRSTDSIVFVYNADSGLFNLLSDMAHKLISPQTYDCQLCMLTHGHLGMHDQWHEYLESLNAKTEFLHRDEFVKKYPEHDAELPALFLSRDNVVELLVAASTIADCSTMEMLIHQVDAKIETVPA
ncbi:MAG: hypothetical protein KAT25_03235 [Sulfuriflexus sp.]|nr:hypothetical protein [Sulfuriflexus sp.]